MANRVGRPRSAITKQEIVGAFARMAQEDREWLLSVMAAVDEGLTPEATEDPERPPNGA